MKTAEQFKELLARYYQRDEETKKQYEDFKSQYSYSNLKKTFNSIPKIEEKLELKLPQGYKSFIEADSAWGMYGGEEDFRIYDENEIYEFNCIGKHTGNSSIEEMKDYFMFGQDGGECSYFFDPFDRLGYGIDAVWKINRGSVGEGNKWFDLVADNFYNFVESYALKNEKDGNYVFYPDWKEFKPYTNDYISHLEKKCKELLKTDLKLPDELAQLEKYLGIMKDKCETFYTRNFPNDESFTYIKSNEEIFMKSASLVKLLYIILKAGDIAIITDGLYVRFLSDLLEKHNKPLEKEKMFAFYYNENSLLSGEDIFAWDLFFIDPENRLGNGPEAVYIICTKSKRLEEACYVAKDIVELFRIFAEGEELNTTPINKIK